jgi:hypothetical protein
LSVNESKPSGWSVLLVVLLVAAGVLLIIFWRIHAFDPWLNAKFPRIYPALIGLISLAGALKLMFRPSSKDIERGTRWFGCRFC